MPRGLCIPSGGPKTSVLLRQRKTNKQRRCSETFESLFPAQFWVWKTDTHRKHRWCFKRTAQVCGGKRRSSWLEAWLKNSSALEQEMDSRKGRLPKRRCAKKMFLAMEQLASMADADCPAHEDPNCSTIAAFVITATEAAQTRRHGRDLGGYFRGYWTHYTPPWHLSCT